jgi:hypothetical protein
VRNNPINRIDPTGNDDILATPSPSWDNYWWIEDFWLTGYQLDGLSGAFWQTASLPSAWSTYYANQLGQSAYNLTQPGSGLGLLGDMRVVPGGMADRLSYMGYAYGEALLNYWAGVVRPPTAGDVAVGLATFGFGTVARRGVVAAVDAPIGFTRAGERFVRVGATPRNLNFTFGTPGGVRAGTHAFPEETFLQIGENPLKLRDLALIRHSGV